MLSEFGAVCDDFEAVNQLMLRCLDAADRGDGVLPLRCLLAATDLLRMYDAGAIGNCSKDPNSGPLKGLAKELRVRVGKAPHP